MSNRAKTIVSAIIIVACAASVYATGCHVARRAATYAGASVALGKGAAHSWVTIGSNGKPTAIGVTFNSAALKNLPSAANETEYVLPLPAQAKSTPFEQIAINWNPRGHDPKQFYGVPHFDFHFYMIGMAQRDRITATGDDLAKVNAVPPAQYVPKGYVATPGGVPRMGAHWINPASPEFHGKPFTKTFIHGFYNAHMIFFEPMVALAYLQTKPSFAEAIPLPKAYEKKGYYPTNYSIKYDKRHDNYTVSLGAMKAR